MGDLRNYTDPIPPGYPPYYYYNPRLQPGYGLPGGGLPNQNLRGGENVGNILSNATREYHCLPGGYPNKPPCPAGYHKACLYVDNTGDIGYDYHWYRQEPDGSWSHKRGGTEPIMGVTNPTPDANNYGYEQFGGCLCVPNTAEYNAP